MYQCTLLHKGLCRPKHICARVTHLYIFVHIICPSVFLLKVFYNKEINLRKLTTEGPTNTKMSGCYFI